MIIKNIAAVIVLGSALSACQTGAEHVEGQEGIHSETRTLEAADQRVFEVTLHYTQHVLPADIEHLFEAMEVMPVVADEPAVRDIVAAAVTAPATLDPDMPEIAVTLHSVDPDVDVGRYFWTWPREFIPTARPGVLGMDTEEHATRSAILDTELDREAGPQALSASRKWWGFRLKFSRPEICKVLEASTAGAMTGILAAMGLGPAAVLTAPLVTYLVAESSNLLSNYIGKGGMRVDVKWSGKVSAKRRGSRSSC